MKKLFVLSLFILLSTSVHSKDSFKIVSNSHYVTGYWGDLVKQALEATVEEYGEYEILVYEEVIGNERHRAEMQTGKLINVRIGVSTVEREEIYIPIKIPLRKGLLNYRLLVAKKGDIDKLKNVDSIDELRKFKFGSVDSWVTTKILEDNQFEVVPVVDSSRLFGMLKAQRYDLALRGVNEVFTELELDKNKLEVAVVPDIGVYISSPTYIFVSKTAPRLAERLTKGLDEMIVSGEFDEIFYKWHKESIDKAKISERKFIVVDNPELPQSRLPKNPKLWLPDVAKTIQ